MARAEIRAAHKTAAHRRGCDASAVRPACSPWRAPRATAHCTSCSPMPRLRQCAATRTSSIRPREAPCELRPGRMQSCRQPTTAPSPSSATTSWIFGSRSSRLERPEIGRRQRILEPFARAAERIVRQHRHDGADIVAAGAPDGDGGNRGHECSSRSQRAGGRPSELLGLADPAPHRGIAVEVKAALMRQPGIGQQRDVGERDAVADQKPRRGELMLHPRQRGIAALDLVGIEIGGRLAEIDHLEAAHRDIGLVAVLFPEQPLVHLRRRKGIGRESGRCRGRDSG